MLDGVKQDWYSVMSILEHTLLSIKVQLPQIKKVYLRSDNAGCYHNGHMWLCLPEVSKRTCTFIYFPWMPKVHFKLTSYFNK